LPSVVRSLRQTWFTQWYTLRDEKIWIGKGKTNAEKDKRAKQLPFILRAINAHFQITPPVGYRGFRKANSVKKSDVRSQVLSSLGMYPGWNAFPVEDRKLSGQTLTCVLQSCATTMFHCSVDSFPTPVETTPVTHMNIHCNKNQGEGL
jgi:hypothetical protein